MCNGIPQFPETVWANPPAVARAVITRFKPIIFSVLRAGNFFCPAQTNSNSTAGQLVRGVKPASPNPTGQQFSQVDFPSRAEGQLGAPGTQKGSADIAGINTARASLGTPGYRIKILEDFQFRVSD
jgi:hypothetical protein